MEKCNGKQSPFKCNDIMIDRIAFNKLVKQVTSIMTNNEKDFIYYFGTSGGIPITVEMKERWHNPNNK